MAKRLASEGHGEDLEVLDITIEALSNGEGIGGDEIIRDIEETLSSI